MERQASAIATLDSAECTDHATNLYPLLFARRPDCDVIIKPALCINAQTSSGGAVLKTHLDMLTWSNHLE
eukprot:2902509-Amphidinium_carterae.1